jgi:phosphoglycolate phosphatase-like HAD superfamily hydrolase
VRHVEGKESGVAEAERSLVLWDIDRTLLYVGEIDRQVYREAFAEIVGRPAERLPARGTGVTMPLAIRSLLLHNGVPTSDVPQLLPRIVELLPQRLAGHEEDLREQGVLMPGALSALKAVHEQPHCVTTVVTGNLRPNALLKLEAFGLDAFLDTEIGGYSSDDEHRPALVAVAQKRAQAKLGATFTRSKHRHHRRLTRRRPHRSRRRRFRDRNRVRQDYRPRSGLSGSRRGARQP